MSAAPPAGHNADVRNTIVEGDIRVGDVYHGSRVATAEALVAGYLADVREWFAPQRLLGRDDELVILESFCRGDDPYLWWEAAPWAGKTGLLAWFSLHHPDDIQLVCFFIRAATAESDFQAFLLGVLPQLALIAGESLPADWRAAGRNLYNYLLDSAAEHVSRQGKRLVLIIDGLDEDTGVPSIVSHLPKHPHAAIRTVLSSRATPNVAIDIPADHPLNRCARLPLSASPAAREIEQRAKAELRQLLAGDAMHRDLVGVITVARGGLTISDLVEITGQDEYDIESILNGRAGRVLTQHTGSTLSDDNQRESGYVLAHEQLREHAYEHFATRKRLGTYYEKIFAWADSYKEEGWPADTPEYLVAEYARLLKELNGVDRACGLATDTGRHALLFERTGGDAAALSEINIALDLLVEQSDPDLARICLIARTRDSRTIRYRDIPLQLLRAWVHLGHANRAIGAAQSVLDIDERHKALVNISVALAEIDQVDRALGIADAMPDVNDRVSVLIELARAKLRVGDADSTTDLIRRAEVLAQSIVGDDARAAAFAEVAKAAAQLGDIDWVSELVKDAMTRDGFEDNMVGQIWALKTIAEAAVAASEHHRVIDLVARAEAISKSIVDVMSRSRALLLIAETALYAGDTIGMVKFADLAEDLALSITDAEDRSWTFQRIARLRADGGDIVRALEVCDVFTDDDRDRRSWTLIDIAKAAAEQGDSERSLMVIEDLDDDHQRNWALAEVVEIVANAGDIENATRLAESIDIDLYTVEALSAIAESTGKSGDFQRAEELAHKATDIISRDLDEDDDSLKVFARDLAKARDIERAVKVANVLPDFLQSDALMFIAEGIASSGDVDVAIEFAESIEYSRDDALVKIAIEIARDGDITRAFEIVDRSTGSIEDLTIIAQLAVEAGDAQHAIEILDKAEKITRRDAALGYTNLHSVELIEIARVALKSGDLARANRLINDAEQAGNKLADSFWRSRSRGVIAQALAEAGAIDRAIQVVRTIDDGFQKAQALEAIATTIADRGDFDDAIKVARAAPSAYSRITTLARIVESAVLVGNTERALAIVQSTVDGYDGPRLLIAAATAMAQSGDTSGAVDIAGRVESSSRDNNDLSPIANIFALAGYTDRAEAIVRSLNPWKFHSPDLVQIAHHLALTGHRESAARVLARAWLGMEWTKPLTVLAAVDLLAAQTVVDHIAGQH